MINSSREAYENPIVPCERCDAGEARSKIGSSFYHYVDGDYEACGRQSLRMGNCALGDACTPLHRCDAECLDLIRRVQKGEPLPDVMVGRFADCVQTLPSEISEKFKLAAPAEYRDLIGKLRGRETP